MTTRRPRWFLTGVLSLGSVSLATGQSPASTRSTRPIELADYYRLISVGSPALSPDGRRVAFIRTHTIEAENRRHGELWIAPTDGSSPPARLANPAWSAAAPGWSPDGQLLSFRSSRRAPGQPADQSPIWFLDMEQPRGEAFQIDGVTEAPVWSPDGKWMAFTLPTRPAITSPAAPKGETERTIERRFTGRVVDWMNYRFDGRGYLGDPRDPAATPPRELYVVAREGGTPRRLTSLGVNVNGPAWSPDGTQLAFSADTHQRDEYNYGRADLFTVRLDGTVTRLTDDGFDHGAPAWTPDGTTLVFTREESLNAVIARGQSFGAPTDLYGMAASGGPVRNLTPAWDLLPGTPSLSRDGAMVYFSAGIGGATHLFRVPLTGGAVQQVSQGERRLGEFDADAGWGRMVYTGATAEQPADLFTAAVDTRGELRLTAFNDALLREIAVAPARRVSFRSKDGTDIEGWLLLPPGYGPAAPVPMILAMHGGPHGAYGYDFSTQFQLWAARGYAVLYTNPRGSTGYGEKFLWGTWGGWGVLDLQDVMAGVDYAIANYRIDPRRLGVTGYSYGGFLTDWAITQTPRFAAAVAGAGISNWISDYGTADIPRTKESEFYGTPWQEKSAALLWRLSPIAHAARVVTPLLLIHGEADLRVPIEQAEQMYTALQKRKVPARFVRYPDMYHGGWTPWNTVHRYHQELLWWAEYLK